MKFWKDIKNIKNSVELSNKQILKEHKWICTSKVCLNTLKELEETFLTQENIWK